MSSTRQHGRCQMPCAETQAVLEPRVLLDALPRASVRALEWGLPQALAGCSLRGTSLLLPQAPASQKKLRRAGPLCGNLPTPHPQAESQQNSASPRSEPPWSCQACPTQPPVRAPVDRPRKANGPSWDRERKKPRSCHLIGILNG